MAVTNPTTLRVLGVVQILCGVALIVGMALLLNWMGGMLANPGQRTTSGNSFNGTADQAWWILHLFWTILGFGVVALCTGLLQVITARRHPVAIAVILIAFVAVALMTWKTVSVIK